MYPVVRHDGSRAVLKVVTDPEINSEKEALAHGLLAPDTPALLAFDPAARALLIERLEPGDDLTSVGEDEAIDVFANLTQRIQRPIDERFPSVDDFRSAFAAVETVALPSAPNGVALAIGTFDRLLDTEPKRVLLHGDLHHGNVLRSQQGWKAIDPDPINAEPAYAAAAFMRNPYGRFETIDDLPTFLRERSERLALLTGHDARRIREWAFVRATLAVAERYSRGELHGPWLRVVRALSE